MQELNFNEKNDFVLKFMYEKHHDAYVRKEALIDEMRSDIYPNDLEHIFKLLSVIKFVEIDVAELNTHLRLTASGYAFVKEKKSFTEQEKRENQLFENTKESLLINRKNYKLTILIAIITAIGVIITAISLYKSMN